MRDPSTRHAPSSSSSSSSCKIQRMMSRVESAKKGRGDSDGVNLLNEIDVLSKTLYLDKNSSKGFVSAATSRSKSLAKPHLPDPKLKQKSGFGVEDVSQKDKKSIWNWRPLKAFSRTRRIDCSFCLQVHSIEGLPASMNGVSLQVHWKRRDGELVTSPAKILQGVAKFKEKLVHDCQVYGSRSGPHHSAKYDAKHFLLYAMVLDSPELDLGKHRIDVTSLLPITLEELEGEKSSGKWSTTYKLSGKAAGAVMKVSFGYSVIGDDAGVPKIDKSVARLQNNLKQGDVKSKIRRSESLNHHSRVSSLSVENIKDFHEELPTSNLELANSMIALYQKFDEEKVEGPVVLNHESLDQHSRASSLSVEDIKDLHEALPTSNLELAGSVIALYQKFDEEKVEGPVDLNPELDMLTDHIEPVKPNTCHLMDSSIDNVENGHDDKEFSVAELVMELSSKAEEKSDKVSPNDVDASVVESIAVSSTSVETNSGTGKREAYDDQYLVHDDDLRSNDTFSKESLMKDLESALKKVAYLEMESLDSLDDEENDRDAQSDNLLNNNGKSLNPDNVTESDFLVMLGLEDSPIHFSSESESESPRERLLRQFEKDTLASGSSLFAFETDDGDLGEYARDDSSESGWEILAESFGLSAAEEQQHVASEEGGDKRRAKMLEDLESEALMREWGLNEEAFQYSPPKGGFGSPIDLMPEEEPAELPPLGEGLGPFLQTKSGGFVRSMNPSLFKNAKSGGSLVMQVSSPVVMPAEMGSGVMEILQGLASVGIEKLSMQASKLMPLEDITGKTMQQVAWEAIPALEGNERQCRSENEYKTGQGASHGKKREKERTNKSSSSSSSSEMVSEYVSLEDLAPLAMDKMEALSIEGLRIHSGMSDEEAPPNITSKSIGEISALQGKGINMDGSLGLEGAAGLQLLDIKDGGEDVDGLMGLSLTLDEWMRLDSGELGDEEEISERTTKVLAAHHANSLNTIRGQSKGERRRSKRKCGLLGNNFTVALMVQLRDPLRNYEPVGAPMLSLIQVERVFVPPKPKIYRTVSMARSSGEDNEPDSMVKEEIKETIHSLLDEEAIPKFKITEVHVAGLKTEPDKKKLWGSTNQQQSGSRWLVANGMGKNNKNSFMKPKGVSKSTTPATTKAQSGESLWSISSRILGAGAKWKELAAPDPHKRNPNVTFPNEANRLR